MLEYVNRGFGDGHVATVTAWLVYMREHHRHGDGRGVVRELRELDVRRRHRRRVKAFAVVVVVAMTALNIAGSTVVARVQSLVVFVVVGILAVFAVGDDGEHRSRRCSRPRATRACATSSRASR